MQPLSLPEFKPLFTEEDRERLLAMFLLGRESEGTYECGHCPSLEQFYNPDLITGRLRTLSIRSTAYGEELGQRHPNSQITMQPLSLPKFKPLFTEEDWEWLLVVFSLRREPQGIYGRERRPPLEQFYDPDFIMKRLRTPSIRSTACEGSIYTDHNYDCDSTTDDCLVSSSLLFIGLMLTRC